MVYRNMATPDEAIWEMHALLHELLGGIKAQKERLSAIEAEAKKLSDGMGEISALREAVNSAKNQRATLFDKVDVLEQIVAEVKANQENTAQPVRELTPTEAFLSQATPKRVLIAIGLIGVALGLWTIEDLKQWVLLPAAN
jgi:predicted  nucleic acid-binding Zn-ribbon protein